MFHSFEEFDVWKRACALTVRLYGLLKECREFGLKDQMQRAAVSIASNIAEGSERGGKDFIRFLTIARGSAAELRTQIYIAAKIGIVERAALTEIVTELKGISKMLTGLAKAIKLETNGRKFKDT